jgi:hypothetical protein
LQGSENGRVVTIEIHPSQRLYITNKMSTFSRVVVKQETKPKKSSIDKKNEANINEMIFFLHETTIHKMLVAD